MSIELFGFVSDHGPDKLCQGDLMKLNMKLNLKLETLFQKTEKKIKSVKL